MALLVAGVIGLVVALAPAAGLAAGGEAPVTVTVGMEPPVSLQFGISPKRLPSPIRGTTKLAFAIEEEPGTGVRPGITSATIGLDKSIELDPRGLPICPYFVVQIESAGPGGCPGSSLGHAEATAEIDLPEQPPVEIHAHGGIYNVSVGDGAPRLGIELILGAPVSGALRILVPVRPVDEGRIGSEATIKIPEITGGSGHLLDLHLELGRSFMRHGERVGFVTAECDKGRLVSTLSATLDDGAEAREESIRACSPR